MVKCIECGTEIDSIEELGNIIECHVCGIELEIAENRLIGLQLGPSEE